ncbi:MAG: M50 family metallopeptidase [Candidatus Paceibacterota bacterium]
MVLNLFIFIVVLAVLILVHEFGHFLAAKAFGMRVDEFGIGFPPRATGIRRWGTLFSINWIPLGGFVKIAGEDGESRDEHERPHDTFWSKPIWQRILVLAAGVAMNFLLGWLLLSMVYTVGTPQRVIVTQTSPDSPAIAAGFEQGDLLKGFLTPESFVQYVDQHKGQETSFVIVRAGQERTLVATPRQNPPAGEGSLGIALAGGGAPGEPIWLAMWDALVTASQMFGLIYAMLFKIILQVFGGTNVLQYVSGPVGIFQATADAAGIGWAYLFNLIALISINLAALNIFPFPALDGGRVVFLLVEKIYGKPVNAKVQEVVNTVGFALLIALLIFVSFKDVVHLFG